MEVRQFSFCGFAAARCSSCATTSTTATGLGGGGAVGTVVGLAGARWGRGGSGGGGRAADAQFLEYIAEESHGDLLVWLVGRREPAGLQGRVASRFLHNTDKWDR